ncbi:replication initiation protein, partial [Halomonas elongata]
MSKPQVYKSNALIEASYRLTPAEQRIMLACIAQVRRDQP